MSIAMAVGLYFVIWWTVLFAVLPFGVRTQAEANDVVPGSAPSAPMAPLLVKKVIATSILAALLLGLVWVLLELRPIPNVLPPNMR